MLAVVETIGLWAPLVGLAVLVFYRQRAPQGIRWGIAGCVLASVASLAGFIGSRAMFFGGGGSEGMTERLELWGVIRLILLLVGVLCLIRGVLIGRTADTRPTGAIAGGVVLVLIGVAIRFIPLHFGPEHEGLSFIALLFSEALQFGLIGIGVIILSVGIISSRGVEDGKEEPSALLRRGASKAWEMYQNRPRDMRRR